MGGTPETEASRGGSVCPSMSHSPRCESTGRSPETLNHSPADLAGAFGARTSPEIRGATSAPHRTVMNRGFLWTGLIAGLALIARGRPAWVGRIVAVPT